MTQKELHRLSRQDLLELLVSQEKELVRVKKELAAATEELNERRLILSEAGSIAEASLRINKVFEAAQAAADQYLENIKHMQGDYEIIQLLASDSRKPVSKQLMEKTRQECETLRAQTEAECAAMLEQARKECAEMRAKAAR